MDLVVELDRGAIDLIRLVGLEREIKLLGRTVDLLPEPIEKARLRPISNGIANMLT